MHHRACYYLLLTSYPPNIFPKYSKKKNCGKIYRILNLPPSLIFLSVQFSGVQYIHNHHHYLFPKHFYDLKLCTHYALIPLSPQSLEASNIFSVHTHLSIPYTSQKTNHTISICLFVSGVFHLACFKVHSCYSRY